MTFQKNTLIIIFLLLVLAACGSPSAAVTSQPSDIPPTQVEQQVVVDGSAGEMTPPPNEFRPLPVEQVDIHVGVGSPIPVNIVVDGSWPDLCTQLAEFQQRIENSTITITLQASPEEPNCPQGNQGLPFEFSIPLNAMQLPVGTYSVVVNGVSVPFVWDPSRLRPAENPMPALLSFAASTYQNETVGFEFDYPSPWTLNDLGQIGSRGSSVQLTSWASTPEQPIDQLPAGGSRLDVTLYTWDPKNDLDAYLSTRKQAWDASGMSILTEEEWSLAGGQRAVFFSVLVQDQSAAALFLITTVGEQYLVLSGTGDLEILREIMRTVRPVGLAMQ
jgi:hypothetical protein